MRSGIERILARRWMRGVFCLLARLWVAAVCGLAGMPVPGLAQVRLELVDVGSVDWIGGAPGGYGVFALGEGMEVIRFKARLVEGGESAYFVTFSAGGSGDFSNREARFGSEALRYQLYDSEGSQRTVLKGLPGALSHEVLSGVFHQEEETHALEYVVAVPAGQIRDAGTYTDTVTVTLYSGTLDDFTEQDSRQVLLSVAVREVTELSFADLGGPFDPAMRSGRMDFGILREGELRGLDLRVRSNAGYRVTLESENGGVLRHVHPSVATTVPYVLRLGGVMVDLGNGVQTPLIHAGRVTDANGDAHGISVTIGSLGGAVAGTYRDVITVTVAAQH